jgi:hypothetical protein
MAPKLKSICWNEKFMFEGPISATFCHQKQNPRSSFNAIKTGKNLIW